MAVEIVSFFRLFIRKINDIDKVDGNPKQNDKDKLLVKASFIIHTNSKYSSLTPLEANFSPIGQHVLIVPEIQRGNLIAIIVGVRPREEKLASAYLRAFR